MRPIALVTLVLLTSLSARAWALPPPCNSGAVFEDRNGNGRQDKGESGLPGVKLSDGIDIVSTDAHGNYDLHVVDGRSSFVIKPAGYTVGKRADGLPDYWRNVQRFAGPALKYGGIREAFPDCHNYALIADPAARQAGNLDVLVFADPQPKSAVDVDYYRRDIVEPIVASLHGNTRNGPALGLSLGDIVQDDLSLYPAMNTITATIGVPWLHVAGNHDLDFDAGSDEDSLRTFRDSYGPDTFAWEEAQANFILLDDVVYQPGQSPSYVGGLRAEQFSFLEQYLATASKDRLLVIGVHIPLFDAAPGRETFRHADRDRLFALLKGFPRVLLLSGHSHAQQHVYHGVDSGWHGATPLHEYNVGAACGAFWSGAKDAAGIPDSTMSDGTPNGYARLQVAASGDYQLSWHPARVRDGSGALNAAMALHAPKVLRHGAYPAWGVYANVFMGRSDSRVEFRVDDGQWKPMQHVVQPDPSLLAENARDDEATRLRGYDRSPEATPSPHLWRGALPTDLSAGEHRVQVRTFDPWHGEQQGQTSYRLADAAP